MGADILNEIINERFSRFTSSMSRNHQQRTVRIWISKDTISESHLIRKDYQRIIHKKRCSYFVLFHMNDQMTFTDIIECKTEYIESSKCQYQLQMNHQFFDGRHRDRINVNRIWIENQFTYILIENST